MSSTYPHRVNGMPPDHQASKAANLKRLTVIDLAGIRESKRVCHAWDRRALPWPVNQSDRPSSKALSSPPSTIDLTLSDDDDPGATYTRSQATTQAAPYVPDSSNHAIREERVQSLGDGTKSTQSQAVQHVPRPIPLPDTAVTQPFLSNSVDDEQKAAAVYPLPTSTDASINSTPSAPMVRTSDESRKATAVQSPQAVATSQQQSQQHTPAKKRASALPALQLGRSLLSSKHNSGVRATMSTNRWRSSVDGRSNGAGTTKTASVIEICGQVTSMSTPAVTDRTKALAVHQELVQTSIEALPKQPLTRQAIFMDEDEPEQCHVLVKEPNEVSNLDAKRQSRIEQKLQRNKRNHISDVREEQDNSLFVPIHSEELHRVSSKLVSEHEADATALGHRLPFPPANKPKPPTSDRLKSERKYKTKPTRLGEIFLVDLVCAGMRDQGCGWPEVHATYQNQTSENRHIDTVSTRIKKVILALQLADVSSSIIDTAGGGDLGALKDLNDIVREKVGNRLDSYDGQKAAREEISGRQKDTAAVNQPTKHIHSSDLPQFVRPASTLINLLPDATTSCDRPQAGGKQPSWNLLAQYYVGQDDDEGGESSPESEGEDEVDESLDYVHFIYQVQRRLCSSEQQAAGDVTIEDVQWHDVGEPYTSRSKANTAACAKVLLGCETIVGKTQDWTINNKTDDEGFALSEYSSSAGIVQARVERRLRAFKDRVVVQDKSAWCPRTVYHIKQRVTMQIASDDMAGRGECRQVTERFANGETCADLTWCNAQAVEHFVTMTYEPKSANLNLRDIEIAEAKQVLLEQLDASDQSTLFSAQKETSKGLVEVWVERGKLVGPRNL